MCPVPKVARGFTRSEVGVNASSNSCSRDEHLNKGEASKRQCLEVLSRREVMGYSVQKKKIRGENVDSLIRWDSHRLPVVGEFYLVGHWVVVRVPPVIPSPGSPAHVPDPDVRGCVHQVVPTSLVEVRYEGSRPAALRESKVDIRT